MDGIREVHIDLERFKPLRSPETVERAEPLEFRPAPHLSPRRHDTRTIGVPSNELAYCRDCRADRPMLWKAAELRGRSADSWFVCAECGGDDLEFKLLSYAEAVAKNRREAAGGSK